MVDIEKATVPLKKVTKNEVPEKRKYVLSLSLLSRYAFISDASANKFLLHMLFLLSDIRNHYLPAA